MTGTLHDAQLVADPSRTVARLFLPGEGPAPSAHSRASEITQRVMRIPAPQVEKMAEELLADYSERHSEIAMILSDNAAIVSSRLPASTELAAAQTVVLGAAFTAEFATEGAALCNPSAIEHPDQSGLLAGQLRVAVALRSIGEGHISSISFVDAIIGADDTWHFGERSTPPVQAAILPGDWSRDHFARALKDENLLTALSSAVLRELGPRFTTADLELALTTVPPRLTSQPDSHWALDKLRTMAYSVYVAAFPASSELSQRVLLPAADEEDHGMEDARFARFTTADGTLSYRATYTAYDGSHIAPRLITSPDLQTFTINRMTGPAAQNKGMALFPRLIGGAHLALSRSDGENISLARSEDGVIWSDLGKLYGPTEPWEIVQTGNCGSPIETEHGWVALTHGVGPMRTYSLGALLLDRHDPSKILKRTVAPLLQPSEITRDGYVPNVVYSCGGLLHHDRIWVPIGIGDQRIGVYSTGVDELINAMSPS